MRNCQGYVRRALESVLGQTEANLEVVVVDDGSTDQSAAVAGSLGDSRVRVIPGPGQGIAAALNAGLDAARGEFFSRCDADDYYPQGRLSWQARFLKDHPEFGAVLGSFIHVDEQERLVGERTWGRQECEVTGQIRRGIGKCHLCAFLIRMDAVRSLGGNRGRRFRTAAGRALPGLVHAADRVRLAAPWLIGHTRPIQRPAEVPGTRCPNVPEAAAGDGNG
jgi:glycosyltransferase involved in cell wall biosynthesis